MKFTDDDLTKIIRLDLVLLDEHIRMARKAGMTVHVEASIHLIGEHADWKAKNAITVSRSK